MQRHIKRTLVLVAGVLFIIVGIAGLVLPFVQGFLFLGLGLMLISLYFPTLRAWTQKQAGRHPALLSAFNRAEQWVKKVVGEV